MTEQIHDAIRQELEQNLSNILFVYLKKFNFLITKFANKHFLSRFLKRITKIEINPNFFISIHINKSKETRFFHRFKCMNVN